ncbi:MAG: PAS domain-containing protein [Candidatus Kapabacteria bacterium]|nr:PAS domain-containing protein [Candidatus Kapabacteria bacterium]
MLNQTDGTFGQEYLLMQTLQQVRGLYVLRISVEGEHIVTNDSFAQTFHGADRAINISHIALHHESDQEIVCQALADCIKQGEKVISFTARIADIQGDIHWIRWEYHLIGNQSNHEIHAIGIDITAEKRFETNSLEIVDRFDRITQHLPGSIYVYVLKPDGTSYFSYCSIGMTALLGVSRELLAENAEILLRKIRSDYVRAVMESVYYSAEHITDWHIVFPVIVHGKTVWIEGKSSPQKSPTGNTVWYGYFNDITEQKYKEDKLRDHAQLLEKLAELNPVTISIYDLVQKKTVYYSKSLLEQLGYSGDEREIIVSKIKHNPNTNIHPDDIPLMDEFISSCNSLPDSEYRELEYRVMNSHNQWEWLQRKTTIFERDSEGKPLSLFNSFTFITDRKNTENQMAETYSRLIMAKKMAKLGTWKYIAEKDMIDMSPYFLLLFGFQVSTNVEMKTHEFLNTFIHPLDRIKVKNTWFNSKNENNQHHEDISEHLEFQGKCVDGNYRTYYSVSRFMTIVMGIGTIQDITERVQLEHELRVLNDRLEEKVIERTSELLQIYEVKNSVIEIVTHDVKNMLGGILMQSEMLSQFADTLALDKIQYLSRTISERVHDINKILVDMLEVRRIDDGMLSTHFENKNLRDLLVSIGEKNRVRANIKGIDIMYSLREVMLTTDIELLKEIIENLLTNAIKFSESGSMVSLSLRETNSHVYISVQDKGPGIPEEEKSLLFQRFAKLSNKPTAGESSTGLGLSITKQLVEMIRGEITCESTLGQGSTFTVILPKNVEIYHN